MTRRTNARVAGVTYLLYIAVAFPAMVLFGKATSAFLEGWRQTR